MEAIDQLPGVNLVAPAQPAAILVIACSEWSSPCTETPTTKDSGRTGMVATGTGSSSASTQSPRTQPTTPTQSSSRGPPFGKPQGTSLMIVEIAGVLIAGLPAQIPAMTIIGANTTAVHTAATFAATATTAAGCSGGTTGLSPTRTWMDGHKPRLPSPMQSPPDYSAPSTASRPNSTSICSTSGPPSPTP